MSVARHTAYNLLGAAVPTAVSLATVPAYLHLIGDIRYGVLTIVWLFLGYFGILGPGLSRASSYHIARLAAAPAGERESVFWTAFVVNLGFGVAGGLVLYLIARPLFAGAFKIPPAMRGEVLACLPWLAASIPSATVAGVLGGALQAREWFGVSNAINVGNNAVTQLVPLAIAWWHGPDLAWLIPGVLLARTAGQIPAMIAVARCLPLGVGGGFRRSLLPTMFSYGGWITLSSFIDPVLTTADRILIGSLVSAEAVAYYTIPFNLVGRFSIVPQALSASLFPRLSRASAADGGLLAAEGVASLAAVMTPLIAAAGLALPLFLRLWLGPALAARCTLLGEIFLVSAWINGMAVIPYNLLQANDRPDLTAKFHAIEAVPFLLILWAGLYFFGLPGAAAARTLRVSLDNVLLFAFTRQLPALAKLLPGAALLLLAPLSALPMPPALRLGFAAASMTAVLSWSWHVSPPMRGFVIRRFGRLAWRGAA